MLLNLLAVAGTLAFLSIEAFRAYGALRELGRGVGLPEEHPYFEALAGFARDWAWRGGIAAFLSLLMAGTATLLISHRLAGPMIRMRGYFKALAEDRHLEQPGGRIPTLHFRRGDFFRDLPPAINEALARLETRARERKSGPDRAA